MASVRRSSRSSASKNATSTLADPELDTPSKDSMTPEQTSDSSSSPAVDSTHQANEPPHEKKDQKLEATDPDLIPDSSSSSAVDQLGEAALTPVDNDVQEEEETKEKPLDEQPHSHEQEHKELEPHKVSPGEHEPLQSVHLKDQTIDVSSDSEPSNMTTSSSYKEAEHGSSGTMGAVEHMEAIKHSKRGVPEDSNTVSEEVGDYLAGTYKSPFRHTHKSEKAGKEER
ncbi:hypothetical protein BGZ51_009816 [Haplosporangium sp. Z 767]|nr:hypothetical protein BGZ50_002356 [Haplosporangium sp. Z 11]KAF9189150.1 hypothetical protein BGZ51_009816 [Haplosporangium sp. Z 767]